MTDKPWWLQRLENARLVRDCVCATCHSALVEYAVPSVFDDHLTTYVVGCAADRDHYGTIARKEVEAAKAAFDALEPPDLTAEKRARGRAALFGDDEV
jgi:hypothetical protein